MNMTDSGRIWVKRRNVEVARMTDTISRIHEYLKSSEGQLLSNYCIQVMLFEV